MILTTFLVLEHFDVETLVIINTDISSLTSRDIILSFFSQPYNRCYEILQR